MGKNAVVAHEAQNLIASWALALFLAWGMWSERHVFTAEYGLRVEWWHVGLILLLGLSAVLGCRTAYKVVLRDEAIEYFMPLWRRRWTESVSDVAKVEETSMNALGLMQRLTNNTRGSITFKNGRRLEVSRFALGGKRLLETALQRVSRV